MNDLLQLFRLPVHFGWQQNAFLNIKPAYPIQDLFAEQHFFG